jgi:uncharacterized surface protein with fasciclin (FAS1) repeats
MASQYGIPIGFDNRHMTDLSNYQTSKTRPVEDPNTIMGKLAYSPQFTMFTYLVYQSGYDTLLRDKNAKVTVFAPPNTAFDNLFADMVRILDMMSAREVVGFHILPFVINQADMFVGRQCIETLNKSNCLLLDGTSLVPQIGYRYLSMSTTPTINYTPYIIKGDNPASNGLLHIINSVLIPSSPPVSR